jgi:hypothetical protein
MKADLQRPKTLREEALGLIGELCGRAQHARGGVRADAPGEAPEQLPAGLAGDLAGEVPEREVERPAAAVMKVDVREHPEMALEGEGIVPQEQRLVAGEADHQVPRAIAHEPGIRRHSHDRGIEVLARLAVPARDERRCERQAVLSDLDGGDLVLRGMPRLGRQLPARAHR